MRATLLLLFFATALITSAQPPNDQCANVTPFDLGIGASVTRTGTRTGATTTNDGVPTSTLMTTPNVASVWEAFTTTECSNVTVLFCGTPLPATTMWNFITATCPADVPIYFSYANFGILCANGQYGIQWFNLPAGTYYLPIYCTPAGGAYSVEFSAAVCNPGPANDDCAGAIPLAVNTSCTPTNGSVLDGTFSFAAQSCNGATGDPNDDVWFSFVATSPQQTITMTAQGNGMDAVLELFEGDCTAPNLIACADATLGGGTENIVNNGLTVGSTYRFRVFHYYTSWATDPVFSVCVTGDSGTGLEQRSEPSITIFPTYTDGPVTIAGAASGDRFRIVDHLGKLVDEGRIKGSVESLVLGRSGAFVIEVFGQNGKSHRASVVRY